MRFAPLLFALAASVSPAQAQPDWNCRDQLGDPACRDARLRRALELYGVPSIEAHRAAGDQVYRVFIVSTHGQEILLVAFVRSPGRDPVVRVHYPRDEGNRSIALIEAPVTQAVWDEIVRRAVYFDRAFELRPGEDPALRSICLDGGIYRIEAVGRARGRLPAEVRRDIESTCESGPGGLFAEEMQRLAVTSFAPCAAIYPDHDFGDFLRLRDCRLLRGDRLAAAEVLNLAEGFRFIDGPEEAHRIRGRFAQQTSIDWAGQQYRGNGHQADEFWMERLGAAGAHLYIERVEGESSDRVILTGTVSRTVDTSQGRSAGRERARVRQVWVRDFGGDMLIESATVGRWEPSN